MDDAIKELLPLTSFPEEPKPEPKIDPPAPVVKESPKPAPKPMPRERPRRQSPLPRVDMKVNKEDVIKVKPVLDKKLKEKLEPTKPADITKADLTIEEAPKTSTPDVDEMLKPTQLAPIVDFFGLDTPISTEAQDKMTEIVEYLKEDGAAKSRYGYLTALNKIESKLGPPILGQSRLNRVYQYIRSQQVVKDATEWQKSMKRK